MTRMFEWIIGNGMHDPAGIQAYSSAALVILSFVTLAVLCLYAWDTHKLAKASVEQVKNAQMPFLALVKIKRDNQPVATPLRAFIPPTSMAWAIQNQGNAAAMNIKVNGKFDDGSAKATNVFSEALNPIPVGAWTFISVYPASQITECTIEYSSLDERRFRTGITTEKGELRGSFGALHQ